MKKFSVKDKFYSFQIWFLFTVCNYLSESVIEREIEYCLESHAKNLIIELLWRLILKLNWSIVMWSLTIESFTQFLKKRIFYEIQIFESQSDRRKKEFLKSLQARNLFVFWSWDNLISFDLVSKLPSFIWGSSIEIYVLVESRWTSILFGHNQALKWLFSWSIIIYRTNFSRVNVFNSLNRTGGNFSR